MVVDGSNSDGVFATNKVDVGREVAGVVCGNNNIIVFRNNGDVGIGFGGTFEVDGTVSDNGIVFGGDDAELATGFFGGRSGNGGICFFGVVLAILFCGVVGEIDAIKNDTSE